MIKLRTQINSMLKTIHPRVYYEEAPDTAVYPYLVYDLTNSTMNEDQELFLMDIDAWDDDTNTTAIETLVSQVWELFNRYSYVDNDIQFSIYRQNRGTIREEDSSLRRRKMVFEIRYFRRS